MKLAKYRLQPVLDSKERKKKDAEKALAETRTELERQKNILRDREEEVVKTIKKKDDYSADLMKKMEGGLESGKITDGKMYLEVLKRNVETARKKVEDQKKAVQQWEQKVEAALVKVMEATKEMKVIEKHKENWVEAEKKEIEIREEKEQDEIGQNLYQQSGKRR